MGSSNSKCLTSRAGGRLIGALAVIAVLILPLLGALLAGREVQRVFRFPPPLEIPTGYLKFSWVAALAVISGVAALALSWSIGVRARRATVQSSGARAHTRGARWPAWGVGAVIWVLAWWTLAWTRWEWFEPLQRFTFFPLWLGFIVVVNAATVRRQGSCLMRREPGAWLALFVVSAACWWSFEWLNRFVRNWHYLGAEDFGPARYAVHATICFSTVLPAVAAVAEWLGASPRWRTCTAAGPGWRWLEMRGAAVTLVSMALLALLGTGAVPTAFYPALWVAPLALMLAAPVLAGRKGLAHEVARGDWTRAGTWMIAALVCGFFWELWNWRSTPKWIYTVPGVERWHLFEMPLLGYAGYLPFGLECLLIVERVVTRGWPASAEESPRASA